MLCLDYRRVLLAEPRTARPEALRHRRECRACAEWSVAQRRGERDLQRALAVPVPDGLAARVLMRSEWRRPRRDWRALAAGILALAVVGLVTLQLAPQPAFASAVLEHVYHEPDLLLPGAESVDPARLRTVLARVGGRLDGDVGTVTHAGLCPIRGSLAAHLVVAGAHGPVAVLVMPEAPVDRLQRVEDDWFRGAIVPVGRGSVAVIGAHGEALDELAARIQAALTMDAAGV